jgi:SAM-dependent methyltransferase
LGLNSGQKVLITGCGFGEDIEFIHEHVGDHGEIHVQDLSRSMVLSASEKIMYPNVLYSVSSAINLPYQSKYFDAVFHFGGINLFGDIKKAIGEMERVCKTDGTVLFGDEGIASHLKGTEYAAVAIANNPLWKLEAPMDLLPPNAADIELSYVLGNCFYLIKFSPSLDMPMMNIDILHKGLRGGSARSRYYGQIEGVSVETKRALIQSAKELNISIYDLLEKSINNFLAKK